MARRKKILKDVQIVDLGDRGLSIGKTPEGQVVLVQGAVPGDQGDILVLRKKKGLPFGIVQQYTKKSEFRTEPFCAHFGICGGCKWQHLDYQRQLHFKQQYVQNTLKRIGKVDESTEFLPIAAGPSDQYYRNKLEYSFSNKRWITEEEIESGLEIPQRDGVGFHCPGAFDKVVDVKKCWLQPDLTNAIRNEVRKYAHENEISFYDIRNRQGVLRSLVVRNNRQDQWMLVLSIHDEEIETIEKMIGHLVGLFPQIASVYYCVNQKANDTILDLPFVHAHGEEFLIESLGDVKFQIGPKSFFQTNTVQAEQLFSIAQDFAGLTGKENVYDLYCGIGSISLFMANRARHIVGIEEVPEAIDDARQNAELNQIEHIDFYAGDVRRILTQDLIAKHGKPDLLITDPPRAGMHEDVIHSIIEFAPERIVYISCNPATQARDVAIMSSHYRVVKSRAVDMFPHTHHVENVALLTRI